MYRTSGRTIRYQYKTLSTQSTSLKLDNVTYETEWAKAKAYKNIPGPTKYGLIRGFMPGGAYYKKSFVDYLDKAREQYGNIYRIPGLFGKKEIILTSNVDDFQKIFRTEGVWPSRPGAESFRHYMETYRTELFTKAEGLVNAQGERWGKFRTAVNPVLMQPRNAKTYAIPMQEVSSEFVQRIREQRDPVSHEVHDDFFDDIKRLTFESVSVVALNKQFGLLRKNRDRADAKELFINLQNFFGLVYDLEFQPSVWKYVSTPTYKRFVKCLDAIYETISGYVTDAIEQLEKENRKNVPDSEQSVLEKLLKIDKSIAIVMAMDLFFGGLDATSSTLSGILLQVAKNPNKQAKLREEVRQYLPEKGSTFTVESMKNLPYLRACIKEAMRMHPIGTGNGRHTGENLVLCGYQVPKGTLVLMNSAALLKEERYFPKPNEFIPERWIRGEQQEHSIVPFTYIPFGFGPRMCVGKRIVDLQLEVILAQLVRNFYIEFNYSIENAFKSYTISTPAIPLKFKFTEVEN